LRKMLNVRLEKIPGAAEESPAAAVVTAGTVRIGLLTSAFSYSSPTPALRCQGPELRRRRTASPARNCTGAFEPPDVLTSGEVSSGTPTGAFSRSVAELQKILPDGADRARSPGSRP
jgi:hypothetical protein